jgi:hypothetical protein
MTGTGDRLKIVMYAIWALFVGIGIFSCFYMVRKTKRHEKLIAGWPRVQATVTGLVAGPRRRSYPTYQFRAPNGTLFAGESDVPFATLPGSSVEVAYNPLNPNQSFQVSSESKVLLGCLIPFFAAIIVGMFFIISAFPEG